LAAAQAIPAITSGSSSWEGCSRWPWNSGLWLLRIDSDYSTISGLTYRFGNY
jgi:hypothetical protein